MNRTNLLAIALAVLVAATGAAAAVPGGTVQASNGDTADASESADGEAVEQAGPPEDLLGPVPDFVSEIHSAINGFLDGAIDDLGSAVSDIAGGEQPSDGEQPTDGANADDDTADGSE